MFIRSDFGLRWYRIDDFKEDAPHFTTLDVIVTVITLCEVKKEPVDQKKSI